MPVTERTPFPPINFKALASALLDRIDNLVPMWLPGGVVRNHEYFVHSVFRHEKTPSLSVRMSGENIGCWRDHGGDEHGGDLIGLYAAIHNMPIGKAAVELARENGFEDVAGIVSGRDDPASAPRPVRPAPPPPAPAQRPSEGWQTVAPVPDVAPAPTFKHQYRSDSEIEHNAAYSIDGALHGYVVRFRKSDGGKETLPYTWCTSAKDGCSKWHWRQFDEPRPLYIPGGVSPLCAAGPDGIMPTVILVEGEKKAGILQALLESYSPGIYLVVSWPGGCKAWKKADWTWLNGCTVLIWPDCDGKREPLSKKERDSCLDDAARDIAQAMKPLLPTQKQPGMSAMLGIGAMLRNDHACSVMMLPIPEPLEVEDGWDCADAINSDGWDGARVQAFFGQAQPLPCVTDPDAAGARSGKTAGHSGKGGGGSELPPADATGAGGEGDEFSDHLAFICDKLKCELHEIGVNRKLLITALRKAPGLKDCLGFNELTGAPGTRVAWPWRALPGTLKETDDLGLGDYICSTYKLKAASRASLSEAIETVADQNRFHPIHDWLNEQEHDGKPRIDKWLIYVLGMDPETMAVKHQRYLEMVGRYLLIGLVARVMDPGCKFDYSPVFEGLPGVGKSTFVKTLVGAEFFSDTHFDIGNGKDGFEQLEGLWGYELSELTALRKADSEQVKQFFSSTVDRFRGAYGKYVQAHPRQCVIFCSTNKRQYLYDLTGNRRFWPIWIDQQIKLDWLRKYRGQLFAEALKLYRAGERYAPSREDEELYFEPEQKKRLVETAVQSRLYELLTRDGAPSGEGKLSNDLNQNVTFITLDRLVSALGADAAKSSSLLESQIRGWLDAHGWTYGRESTGQRRRGYKQPIAWPPKIEDDEGDAPRTPPHAGGNDEGDDDEPF